MLTLLKLFAISLAVLQVIFLRLDAPHLAAVLCSLCALFLCAAPSARRLLPGNAAIALFTIVFMAFAYLSGLASGALDAGKIALTAVRIPLMFNCLYLGGLWLGRPGLMRIVDSMPTESLRLFLVLLHGTLSSFLRVQGKIVGQLRMRIDFSWGNRLLVARCYSQNLIYKELYSYRHRQAALYSRFTGMPRLLAETETLSLRDLASSVLIAACFLAARVV